MNLQNLIGLSVLVSVVLIATPNAAAQHCPPIVESYLGGINIKRANDGVVLKFGYVKTGGQIKNAYQAYLIAYSDSDSTKIAELTPQQAIDEKLLTVLDTQLIEHNETREYEFQWKLETEKFVESMITSGRLAKERVNDMGGWKNFNDQLRIAVFIPFLDDKKYSVIDGLPNDKHECNYRGDSALLFETIPQKLSVHFGVVQATRLKNGQYHIQMNGRRPAGKTTENDR